MGIARGRAGVIGDARVWVPCERGARGLPVHRPAGHSYPPPAPPQRGRRRVARGGVVLPPAGHLVDLGTITPHGAAERPVRAWVPADGAATHPLLVLLDGQNVFGDEGSYAGGWHAHAAVDGMTARTLVRPIVVAVHHGGVERNRELGRDVRRTLDAVVEQVLPRAAARFALASPRVIGGSSLGGLAALRTCVEAPEVFDGGLVMSPSLWFEHGWLLGALLAGRVRVPASTRLYLDAGERERGRMFADAAILAARLAGAGVDLMWRPDRRGAHDERSWRRRLPKALRFLFRQESMGRADLPAQVNGIGGAAR